MTFFYQLLTTGHDRNDTLSNNDYDHHSILQVDIYMSLKVYPKGYLLPEEFIQQGTEVHYVNA